ncbi:diacylglycerol kinase [Planctobacterium marinum]|uniref:diacylglycerol kinase n=1 Tax=Planctobacterium marinum TaxID=1631968 RepID=UPI001E4AF317|nr:diacylglycerol kinase [Planctobacterium marinum]MCC2606639.1 diacylglycerol kinase [Planctobacterium marinum]
MHNKPNGTGLARLFKATKCSMDVIRLAWQHESAFRQELTLAAVMCPLAFLLSTSVEQLVLLLMPVFLLVIVELLNSAIEATVDRISTSLHPLSKQAKDIGSAAVFFVLLLLTLTWGLILLNNFVL